MKRYLWSLLTVFALTGLGAQNYSDALRYSDLAPLGTARFAGTGGSLTPMGVDMTTLHTNPAGIGWNRYNMVQITPGFSFTGTDADLAGNALSESVVNLGLPSAGVLIAGTTRSVNWSTLNFGVSVSQVGNFNQDINFNGRNEGSIIEAFTFDVNNTPITDPLNPYGAELAFPFLIEDDVNNTGYYSDFFDIGQNLSRGGNISRSGTYQRSGSATELAIGFGGNYREKLLWGLSIGIPFFSYDEVLNYEEVDDENFIPAFENSVYSSNLSTDGTGFNGKLGLILLPTDQLRISAAVHTPTLYSIDEQLATSFGYFYTDGNNEAQGGTNTSPAGQFNYNLSTPWRFMLGAGYLVGSSGFLSVDADYTNFAANKFSLDDFATVNEASNNSVDAFLGNSIGIRIGGELNVKPFQLRAGVGYRQSPYIDDFSEVDKAALSYSTGLGYSSGKFFVDLAARYQTRESFQDVYDSGGFFQPLDINSSRFSGLLTVGIRGWNAGF